MDVSIQLLRGDKDEVVAATLRVAVAPAQVNEVESVWGPIRKLATDRLKQGGVPASDTAPERWLLPGQDRQTMLGVDPAKKPLVYFELT